MQAAALTFPWLLLEEKNPAQTKGKTSVSKLRRKQHQVEKQWTDDFTLGSITYFIIYTLKKIKGTLMLL